MFIQNEKEDKEGKTLVTEIEVEIMIGKDVITCFIIVQSCTVFQSCTVIQCYTIVQSSNIIKFTSSNNIQFISSQVHTNN